MMQQCGTLSYCTESQNIVVGPFVLLGCASGLCEEASIRTIDPPPPLSGESYVPKTEVGGGGAEVVLATPVKFRGVFFTNQLVNPQTP